MERMTPGAERLREWEEAENRRLRGWADELRDRNDAGEPGTVAVSLEETLGLARAVNEFVYADSGRRRYERMELLGSLEDWAWHVFEERQQFYGELSAERGPDGETPTAEEVDAAMEAYRRRIAAERAEWEREEGWFDVTPDRVDEVQVYDTVLCAECGNPTSVGTVIPNVTDVKGDTLRQVLRPIHLDCFEELQTNSIGRYLSDEIVVELRDFVAVKLEAEAGDE